jgi:hypothetical protein
MYKNLNKPKYLFSVEIVNISVEIKLSNETFKEELNNKSSSAYKVLEKDVYVEVIVQSNEAKK